MRKYLFILLIVLGFSQASFAQLKTNAKALESIVNEKTIQSKNNRIEVEEYARVNNIPIRFTTDSTVSELMFIDEYGLPQYYITDNANSAATISTNRVYSGGGAGLSLTGSGITVNMWDAGNVLSTHVELTGRVTNLDGASVEGHSTFVAGTIMASGDWSDAQGMAYGATLRARDWDNDEAEMAAEAAAGALISNHSYSTTRGWSDDVWYGNPSISTQEDYLFGFYNSWAADWDEIAYNAPNYLIVKSAGNDRGDDHSTGGPYPADGGTSGYDCLAPKTTAKNILAVGSVYDIPGGYSGPGSVVLSSYSSWGPTDDGRIKPDITANGESLTSSYNGSNTAYAISSGTSFSSPSVAGSAALLVEHYQNLNAGANMTAATLKALILHTADDAGNAGPDYEYGWGLMNTESAAAKITENQTTDVMSELYLANGESYTRNVTTTGTSPLRVTIVWTDPAGTPVAASVDPTDVMLVNDLDVQITGGAGGPYNPYILNPANPANVATTGDNNVDNVEQVYIASPSSATTYTITVDHDGTLSGGGQAFSMIISGDISSAVAPEADFYADETQPNINTDVQFTDVSANIPTSWAWSFAPTTVTYTSGNATSQNPVVQFTNTGTYTVTLTATNANGSDIETKTNYIVTRTDPTWTGATDTDWNTLTNWSTGVLPISADVVTIPGSLANYPAVDVGDAICGDLLLGSGAQVIIETGGNLAISNDLNIGDGGLFRANDGICTVANEILVGGGTGGSFDLNGGSVSVDENFNSEAGCSVDISGGVLNIGASWRRSGSSVFSAGTISLSGGSINVAVDAVFSVTTALVGSMTGDFQMTIGNNFFNNDNNWSPITGGTIIVSGLRDGVSAVGSTTDPSTTDIVANNLVVNGPGAYFYLVSDADLAGSLNIEAGTFDIDPGESDNWGINLGGNWTNNGDIFYARSGIVTFDGSAAQTIEGSSSTDFYDVIVDNSNGVSVGVNTNVDNNLTVNGGGVFNINGGFGLTVSGDLANGGTTTVKSTSLTSNGSLIVDGTSTGNITYERYITGDDQWHLFSAPVVGQDIGDFLTDGSNSIATKGSSPLYYAVSDYGEGIDGWTGFYESTESGSFEVGKGYEILRSADGLVSFTGTLRTTDVTDIPITRTGEGWNMLGNPYPSAINATTTAHATNTLLSASNVGNLDASFAALYVWDPASGGSYKTINNSGATNPTGTLSQDYLPPGQGFFVRAMDNSSRTFSITEAMRTHQTGVEFKSTSSGWPTINLIAETEGATSSTLITFSQDMTRGLDVTYDAGMFKNNPDFSLYTRLVEDNGVDFAIQCLPDTDIEDIVIPVGLDAPAGTVVNFKAELMDLPAGWDWYLEDRDAGVVAQLAHSETIYTVTLSDQNREVGSFFLHPGANSTGIEAGEVLPDAFEVFVDPREDYIRISSPETMPTMAQVFDLSGRMISSLDLIQGDGNLMSLKGQNPGIYLLRIHNTERFFSKKIFWY